MKTKKKKEKKKEKKEKRCRPWLTNGAGISQGKL